MNRFRRRSVPSNKTTAEPITGKKKRFQISASTRRSLIILLILAGLFVVAFLTAPFWINWLWFGDMGYRSVLVRTYMFQIGTFFAAALISALLFLTNMRLALRNTKKFDVGVDNRFGRYSNTAISWISTLAAAAIALSLGRYFSNRWEEVMLFFNGREFGVTDPTYGRDVGFYVFQVPFFRTLETTLISLLLVTIVGVTLVYLVRMGIRFKTWGEVPMVAIRHVTALISALLLVMALRYLLDNFELVHSSRGVVYGPGFTDSNIVRPLNWIMILMSALAGIGLLTGYVLRNRKLLLGVLGVWALASFVLHPVLPMAVQRFFVEPSEFRREQGYISHNIELTRSGFGLDSVEIVGLTGQEQLVPSDLDSGPGGELANVRIWDYRVVSPIYQQVQTFVPFYEFNDIDVDRYEIDGQPVQVLVGVREINLNGLAPGRQTWTNQHLVYTHGYGYVMSPVSEVHTDGWPVMMVSGVPMSGPGGLVVDYPQIYFGETDMQWVILFTDQTEIAGLDDSGEREEGFQGEVYGSVSLGNPVTRGMAALTLNDRNVFLSGQLTGESRLVLHRNVLDRAQKIAPFLTYDSDPYLVIADGRMYWLIDAYTETNMYPHATRYDGRNYMRNSVKVAIDAYNGETTFYRTEVEDPIADAWDSIYPGLFTPVAEAPDGLAEHFRYPELLFDAQTSVWGDYHMDDARTWYDGDDKWVRAREASDEEDRYMDPYFVHQTLPSDAEADFWLTIPFTPGGTRTNENMTAWFAGRADPGGNTELRLYRYPRQVTVYGPRQIEAMIDQNPDIASQITLWSQGGSTVIRGNMLVIPVGDALLYVQPLYLQATGSSASAPTLARVIVAANNQVVMRPTLAEAIDALDDPTADTVGEIVEDPDVAISQAAGVDATPVAIGEETSVDEGSLEIDRSELPDDLAGMTDQELANEAMATMNRADEALEAGDPVTYQMEMDRLRLILNALSGGSHATPEATPGD